MDGNPSTLSILSDKYVFLNPNEDQFLCIKNYLDIELDNGQGECFLELGIGDGQCPGLTPQEMNQSVCAAERLADSLSSHLIHLRDRWITAGSQSSATTTTQSGSGVDTTTRPSSAENSHSSPHRHTLRSSSGEGKTKGNSMSIDDGSQSKQSNVRVAVVGNVDAGKSTLLGVLTHGELDNGRGLARLRLLRHKHEAESGRTSSVAHDILGFSSLGQVVNKPVHGHLNWSEICEASAKVNFILYHSLYLVYSFLNVL
ncbi:unnamed protein product [Schistosoma mattheei]|uniref:Uncharacterized protein n=1 Tax=Schistosoma mattheei TaxID=31246 RepID=A0A183PHT9_9TREM|nr:unnamed protein product [Schistosoma mattheei]